MGFYAHAQKITLLSVFIQEVTAAAVMFELSSFTAHKYLLKGLGARLIRR